MIGNFPAVLNFNRLFLKLRADHTGQFRHHPSASPAVIVRKVVGHHLFLNIIPNNFTARTERKVWCDRASTGSSVTNCWFSPSLPDIGHRERERACWDEWVWTSVPNLTGSIAGFKAKWMVCSWVQLAG